MKFHKSCGFVLFRRENLDIKILLLHYPGGHWEFVKGHQEGEETDLETAERELSEETGITKFEVVAGFEEVIKYEYYFEGEKQKKEVIFFLAETTEENVQISEEHFAFKWLEFDKALEQLTYENAKKVLRSARKYIFDS